MAPARPDPSSGTSYFNNAEQAHGGERRHPGCYSLLRECVNVLELFRYEQAEEYYCTFFHELAHATGHSSRLNREGITGTHRYGDAVYSREELVAEMCAAFLCGHTGIENATIGNSAAYKHNWIKVLRGDKKLAVIAAAQAQKAADYILNLKHGKKSVGGRKLPPTMGRPTHRPEE